MENDGEDHAARVVLAWSTLIHPFRFISPIIVHNKANLSPVVLGFTQQSFSSAVLASRSPWSLAVYHEDHVLE